jgi:hypothetical protein
MKKTRFTFLYQAADGSIMRPESFLNINKGRTLSSSQLRVLGITKIKCPQASKSCHPTGWPKGNPKWKKEQGSSK